jgi:type IX secretion system PorP/SprF family membrane protein
VKVKLLIISCLLFAYSTSFSQQGTPSSILNFNPYFNHSAYGGMDRTLSISLQTRAAWSNLEGRPSTQYIGGHMPVYIWKGSIGGDILTHAEGNLRFNRIRGSYNYVMPYMGGLLSMGGRLGISQVRLDGSKVRTPQGSYIDGIINHRDPALGNTIQNGFSGLWEVSALYTNADFQVMASLSNLVSLGQSLGNAKYANDKTLNFLGQYFYTLSPNLILMPGLSIMTNFNVVQTEVRAIANFNVKNYAGLCLRGYSGRTIDALGIVAGHRVSPKFSLYYAYDIGLSGLRSVHDGTHDLIVRINLDPVFGKNLPPRIIYNPRFL